MELTFKEPTPTHVIDATWNEFSWQPADHKLLDQMQQFLNETFPGPTWRVQFTNNHKAIFVQWDFDDPEEHTMWLLRWS